LLNSGGGGMGFSSKTCGSNSCIVPPRDGAAALDGLYVIEVRRAGQAGESGGFQIESDERSFRQGASYQQTRELFSSGRVIDNESGGRPSKQ
jgi:hypothetical protein